MMNMTGRPFVMAVLFMFSTFGWAAALSAQMKPSSREKVEACRAGDVDACWRAEQYIFEENPEAQQARQQSRMRGCELKNVDLCYNAADMFERGTGYVSKSIDSAIKYYGLACELGEPRGCFSLKRLNGSASVSVVTDKIQENRIRCKSGVATACSTVAFLLEHSESGVQGKSEALALYKRGCQLGDRTACYNGNTLQDQMATSQRESYRTAVDSAARNDPNRRFGANLSQSDRACLQDINEEYYTSERGRCLIFSTLRSGSQGCDRYETVSVKRFQPKLKNICNKPISFQEYCGQTPFGWATLLPGELYKRKFTSPCRLAY